MRQLAHQNQRPASPVAALGLRRVECVRLSVGQGPAVAEVSGVAYRYPRTFRVSLATAARLADVGVPVRIERRGQPGPPVGVR